MKKTQKGFAVIESLLIIVIIAIIGGTGFYVWHSKKESDKNLNNAVNTNLTIPVTNKQSVKSGANTTPAKTPVEQSNTAKSADGKTEVSLPDGWKIESRIDGGTKCGFADPNAGGTCVSDISFQDNSGKLDSYVKIFKSSMNPGEWYNSVFGSCDSDNNDITVNGNPGIQCGQNSNIENVIANGSYVLYFYGPNSSSENSLVRSTQFL